MARHPCFVSGSKIRAARGEIAIEQISAGDEVIVLRDGHEAVEPVKWIGHTNVDLARHAYPEEAAPIRIRAGALAANEPARDLLVSPEHCMIIDGLCVPAKLLVNGGSISSERDHTPFTYYHLELERHGILVAEGAATESYLDTGNRSAFDNADGPRQLHPRFQVNADAAKWQTDACAPLARGAEQIDPIWSRLAERSEQIGYPIPTLRLTDEADIHLIANGRTLRPVAQNGSRYTFMVPASVSSLSLMSRFCIPADKLVAGQRDTRRLGVRVASITIRSGGAETVLAADHPDLQAGWHSAETDGADLWRWTDGAAAIPMRAGSEASVVTIDCTPVAEYPVYDDRARLVA
jgi:antigen 43